jgi:hypothetical protein
MFVISTAAFLMAQSRVGLAQMTAVEQALADKINCDDWKKKPE